MLVMYPELEHQRDFGARTAAVLSLNTLWYAKKRVLDDFEYFLPPELQNEQHADRLAMKCQEWYLKSSCGGFKIPNISN